MRVPLEHEVEGLDLAECGVEAYGREAPATLAPHEELEPAPAVEVARAS